MSNNKTTLEMTKAVIQGSLTMEKVVIEHLKELGFVCEQISQIDIQTVANTSCKEER